MLPYDSPLLQSDEPPAYTILNPHGKARCILTCEHAGRLVPRQLNMLGLEDEDFTRHYATDPGVRRVTETLSQLIDAPAILGNYSRLVVDLNRSIGAPTAFAPTGEGKPVPGNVNISDEDKACRTREIYDPYHTALDAMINHALGQGFVPPIISIHSFTPRFFNFQRPWQVGFLWTHNRRLPGLMIDYFIRASYVTGDNQPYDHRILRGSAINRHGDERGLPNVLVEIRNDLISNDAESDVWAKNLADCLEGILADPSIYAYYDGPLTPYDPERERLYYDAVNEAAKRGEHYG